MTELEKKAEEYCQKENVIYEESFNTDLCNGCNDFFKLQEENEELKKTD